MRLTRVLTALALGVSALLPSGAQAAQTLAFTFVVPCSDADGVWSHETAGLTLPNGWYAVATAGVCTVGHTGYAVPVGTPCVVQGVPVPCVSTTIANLPNAVCHTSTGGVSTDCVPQPSARLTNCGMYSVVVAGDCVTSQGGLVHHTGGSMNARFVDTVYGDNVGYLLVTVAFTPL